MVGSSKMLEVLPSDFGYVIFTGVGSIFVNTWLALNVVKARKKYKIEYPQMYSPDNKEFNCIQRAHQHNLELYPQFILLLLFGGVHLPKLTAGAGAIFLLGRIAYAKGYYTGDPEKRHYGAFGMVGLLIMLGNSVCFAFHCLKWNPFKSIR